MSVLFVEQVALATILSRHGWATGVRNTNAVRDLIAKGLEAVGDAWMRKALGVRGEKIP